MSLPTEDEIFALVRAVSQTHTEYPFIESGDNSTKVYHLICVVNQSAYAPIALDTPMAGAAAAGVIALPFPADTAAYFVGDFNHSPLDGGMLEFERVFANIPTTRNEIVTGTTSYTYPGVAYEPESSSEYDATGFSDTATTTTLSGLSGGTYTVGDIVEVKLSTEDSSGVTMSITATREVIQSGSSSVTVSRVSALTDFVSGSVSTLTNQPKGSISLATGTFTDFTYYLPGVTADVSTPKNVPVTPAFRTSALLLSSSSIPPIAEYNSKVTNKEFLTIESKITRYMGNIIERADIQVIAQ